MRVIKAGKQIIKDFDSAQKRRIMNDLTLKNPKFMNAIKYSNTPKRYIQIDEYLTYYDLRATELLVPAGYKIPFEYFVEEDRRVENRANFDDINITLRKAQEDAYLSFLENPENGIIVMPTGTGKSIFGLYLAYALRQKTLIIVHKNDLVRGWNKDIDLCFGEDYERGLIKASNNRVEDITIATVQTLANRPQMLEDLKDHFGLVIVDECLVGDSFISTADGGFKQIENIDNDDNLIGGEVSNKFSRVSPETIKVKFYHGELEGSPTHPTFVLPYSKVNPKAKDTFKFEDLEVKPLKDIKKSDYVPILKKISHTQKYSWSKEQLSFVSLIIADGHIDKAKNSRRIKVNVSKDFDFYREVFYAGVKSFGNYEVKESLDCRDNLTLWVNSNKLKDILMNTFGIDKGKKGNTIKINEQIQYAPIESIKSFISTFYNCEGDISISKAGSVRANINSTSRAMMKGMSLLFRKFEILPTFKEIKSRRKNHNHTYRLCLGGKSFNDFSNKFDLLERKDTDLRNPNGFIGYDIGDYILSRVKSIEKSNEAKLVYDYTTSSHKFIANGALTHNCHHTPAKSYELVENFNSYYKVGLSATPERSDGLDEVMNFYFGDTAYNYDNYDYVHEDILPVKVVVKQSSVNYMPQVKWGDEIRDITAIPYKNRPNISNFEIDRAILADEDFVETMFNDVKEQYDLNRSCIVFFKQKQACEKFVELLKNRGLTKSQLYYGESEKDDEFYLNRAEEKDVLVTVSTYGKATEGTNVKSWEVAFLGSSVSNAKNVEQAVGRIRRAKKGKINPVLVFDYRHPKVYQVKKHGRKRDKRYRKLDFEIVKNDYTEKGKQRGLFSRGYK